jgi:hypothetical protein
MSKTWRHASYCVPQLLYISAKTMQCSLTLATDNIIFAARHTPFELFHDFKLCVLLSLGAKCPLPVLKSKLNFTLSIFMYRTFYGLVFLLIRGSLIPKRFKPLNPASA